MILRVDGFGPIHQHPFSLLLVSLTCKFIFNKSQYANKSEFMYSYCTIALV